MQCKMCLLKEVEIASYKNSTSNLRKHVEVSEVILAPMHCC